MDIKSAIDNIIDKSKEITEQNAEDYTKDGILYCGKCNTAKQVEITVFGVSRKPYCMCKCAAEKAKKEEEQRQRYKHKERVKELRRVGFSESSMKEWTFENDDMENEKITKAMQNYVDNFDKLRLKGKGLLLLGNTGTGKTYAACEVANALIDKGYPVMVTNFARIINTLQGTFEKQEYIDSFNNYALLVIDDLGIERDTEFAKEQVYNVIDNRYRAGLPMIITTNLTIDKIKSPEDIENGRIYDRIIERCFPIEVTGRSRRRKVVRDDYDDMKNLLGL